MASPPAWGVTIDSNDPGCEEGSLRGMLVNGSSGSRALFTGRAEVALGFGRTTSYTSRTRRGHSVLPEGSPGPSADTQRTLGAHRSWSVRWAYSGGVSWFVSLMPMTKMLAQSPELCLGSKGLALRVAHEVLSTMTCMLLSSDFFFSIMGSHFKLFALQK